MSPSAWNADICTEFLEYTDHTGIANREARRLAVGEGVAKVALGQQYHSDGAYYFETQPNFFNGGDVFVGVALATTNLFHTLGYDRRAWSIRPDGKKYHDDVLEDYASAFDNGASIGILVDFLNDEIRFYVNGVDQGVAFMSIQGHTLFPATSIDRAQNVTVIATVADQLAFLPANTAAWG